MKRKTRTAFTSSLSTANLFSQESLRISNAASQLAIDSGITISHRLPQFMGAAFGLPAAQAEVRNAVIEKWSATMEAQMATAMAMMSMGWAVAFGSSSEENVRMAADIAHAAIEPSSRRAKANATRLSSGK